MKRSSAFKTLVLCGTSILAQSMLAAETASAQTASNDKSSYTVEDVIVTATRRETTLQRTAAAVTAFQAEALANAPDIVAISSSTPNTEFLQTPTGFVAYIRGVGNANASIDGDQNVAFYLDGVYLEKGYGADMDLADVARVEVLRGPQGTLYGRNATAGAVNIVLAEPGDTLNGSLSVAAGNYSSRQVRGTIGGPITNQLGGRLSFSHREHDGYVNNLTGPDVQDQNQDSVRGILALDLNDRARLRLVGDYSRSDDNGTAWKLVSDQGLFGVIAEAPPPFGFGLTRDQLIPPDFRAVAVDASTKHQVELWGVAAHADFDLTPNLQLNSITAYRHFHRTQGDDVDGTRLPLGFTHVDFENVKQTSQELQLHGQWSRLDWVGGVFYYDMDSKFSSPVFFLGPLPTRGIGQTTTAWAVFSDAIFHVTDQLDLQAGLRYSDEKKTRTLDANLSKSWNAVTPRVGVSYRLTPDVMLFANVSEGFKSGGFNPGNLFVGMSAAVNPEKLRSYELGVKTGWFDGRLHLNATAFQYNYKDLQVQSFILVGGSPEQVLSNAAGARTRGVEVEFDARPTSALSLSGFASYLDAKYTSFPTVDQATGNPIDLAENFLPHSPKWKVGLRGQYDISLASAGTLSLGANVTWTDEFFHIETNAADTREPSHENVSASVSYSPSGGHWRAEVFGDNLTDEDVASSRFEVVPGNPLIIQGTPRTYGFRLGYTF